MNAKTYQRSREIWVVLREYGLVASVTTLAISIIGLFLTQSPALAYAGLISLLLAVIIYLLPGREATAEIVYPRTHRYFRLLRYANIGFIPLTFIFVYFGLQAALDSSWLLLGLICLIRVFPGVTLNALVHRLKRGLIAETVPVDTFDEIEESALTKIQGYVYETRTRRRRLGTVLYNAWLVDGSATKVFIPTISSTPGVTETLREGNLVVAVGPTASSQRIVSLQPIASVIMPPEGRTTAAEWFDVVWRRSRWRRALSAALGTFVFLATILILGWVASEIVEYVPGSIIIPILAVISALFFASLSEKLSRESARYEVQGYFEPSRLSDSPEQLAERRSSLHRLVNSGKIPDGYLKALEEMGEDS